MKEKEFLIFLTLFASLKAHAIFWEPPSRASLGIHNQNFCKVPVNYDHMSVYCGGVSVQHSAGNQGRCGICGDPFDAPPQKKPHEKPFGRFATGIITRHYRDPGQVIPVIIDVVANHGGFFAFALCVNNNPDKDPDQGCFRQLPLDNGDMLYRVTPAVRKGTRIELGVKLPAEVECWQCILQWTYVAGNSWGHGPQMFDYRTEECADGKLGQLGCGPQETFRGCADICIGKQ